MPSRTRSREPISRSLNRSRWMRVSVFALVCLAGSLLWWNDARTADITQENRGFNRVMGSSVEPAQYVPGEVIVKFRGGASQATIAAAHAQTGGQTIKSFAVGAAMLHHLQLSKGVNVEDALAKYRQSPAVEYAQPNYIRHVTAIPNDTQFTSLWGLHNIGQDVDGTAGTAGVDIDAPRAWDLTTGSPTVIIGVVDTGIAYDHPDLAPNIWVNPGEIPNDGIDNDGNGYIDDVNGYDFSSNDPDPMDGPFSVKLCFSDAYCGQPGHGTHVAGTIAAVGNNGLGITGVMHTAKLMALKAGDVKGSLSLVAILQAEEYARVNGARAINASFGSSGSSCSQAEYDMLSALNTAGVMFLAAAGNDNLNTDVDVNHFYPAQYSVATTCGPALPNVIAVAAIDQHSNRASFSNFGPTSVQIAAPGVNINSTRPTSNVTFAFFHNYDSNPGALGYTFTGTNSSWGFTNKFSDSPPTSLTDSPTGNYLSNTNSFAISPMFSTMGQRGCRFVGAVQLATELNHGTVLLDISRDGGATWTPAGPGISGSTFGSFINFPFSDIPDRRANNRFRINFFSDSSSGVDDGVYLDNVGVACTSGAPSGTTDYQFLQGTSMATPHVTGVVGLVLAAASNLNVAQIRAAILNTGVSVPALNGLVSTGRRLNAHNAVASVMNNFTVTVTKAGTGTGTVTSSPSGIDCDATCSGSFPSPGSVTLSATPTGGSTFDGWTSGSCAGTGTCILNVNAAVTATFTAAPSAPPPTDGGGGGCTLAPTGTSDALLPIMLLLTIGTLMWRGRRRSELP
jgi:subtilisin family serine protease